MQTTSESPAPSASFSSSLINPDASPTAIQAASASETTETAEAGQTESEPAESGQTEETRQAGSRKEEPQKNRTEETEQPGQQKPAAAEPENPPAQTPEPEPVPTPEPELEWSGDSYGSAVCEGVNEVRAMYGKEPLSYGGSGGLESDAEAMARAGSIWGANSRRSVSNSSEGGKSMGVRSAGHAAEIAQGDYSVLYVVSVKYNGKRYTIVEAG